MQSHHLSPRLKLSGNCQNVSEVSFVLRLFSGSGIGGSQYRGGGKVSIFLSCICSCFLFGVSFDISGIEGVAAILKTLSGVIGVVCIILLLV